MKYSTFLPSFIANPRFRSESMLKPITALCKCFTYLLISWRIKCWCTRLVRMCKSVGVRQNLDDLVVSNEAAEISPWHTEMSDAVRELWVSHSIESSILSFSVKGYSSVYAQLASMPINVWAHTKYCLLRPAVYDGAIVTVPIKCPFMERCGLFLKHHSVGPLEFVLPLRHLDRFIRFCTAKGRDQHTQTNEPRHSICSNRPHLWCACDAA